jgi:hypothetical protein
MSQRNNLGNGDCDLSSNSVNSAGPQVVGAQSSLELSTSYTPNANTTVVGSSVISHLPDEECAVLKKMEFQVLLDGDIAGAKAGRDMFLGFLISGLIGLIGLLATTNWDEVFTKGEWGAAIWTAVMFAIVLASAGGWVIYAIRKHKVSQSSAYSELIGRLQKHFGIDPK